jgi:hypothetical protein
MEDYSKDKKQGDDIACPLCRKKFKIPHNGVKGLPKNFLIEQLKDIVNAPGACEKARERKAPTSEMKVFCEQHKKKTLELFCLDCKKPICAVCCAGVHKKHNCVDVDEVAEEYRKHMTSDVKRMVGSLAQCRELVKKQKKG